MAVNRTLVSWSRIIHIYLSIALLIVLVFFSVTGITLNHATTMTADPVTSTQTRDALPELPRETDGSLTDSLALAAFLKQEFGVRRTQATLDQEEGLLIVDYRAPGATTYVEIDTRANTLRAETTDFGLVATLNDLHKARDTNVIWYWLVDTSAVLLVLFSLAGFVLLLPNIYRLKRVLAYTLVATLLLGTGYFLGSNI
ncbi:MAG: hypothetical protein RLZZ227_1789 [Pseudomonadota bacterium]|jgi:hypothetical protein